jgi:hypothetical protein
VTTLSTSSRGLRKTLRYNILALLLSVAPTVQANAEISIVDVYNTDANVIQSQFNFNPTILLVNEDYKELTRIPYPSHDGSAIVNSSSQYFDTVVTYTGASVEPSMFQFRVTNTTPWQWSDYHFELWDSTFTTRLDSSVITSYNGSPLTNSQNIGGVVSFLAPFSQNPSETGVYLLGINLQAIGGADGNFGIRQVATTVPEPGTIMLMGIGAVGMMGVRNAKRREV